MGKSDKYKSIIPTVSRKHKSKHNRQKIGETLKSILGKFWSIIDSSLVWHLLICKSFTLDLRDEDSQAFTFNSVELRDKYVTSFFWRV